MKYSNLTFGQSEAIVNKLGGMQGVQSFLSGETKVVRDFEKPWITISLRGNLFSELISSIINRNKENTAPFSNVSKSTRAMIGRGGESIKVQWVNLIRIRVTYLGFQGDATYQEICDKAESFGLSLCSTRTVLNLALDYKAKRGVFEDLYVATKPINDDLNDPCLFILSYYDNMDGDLFLLRNERVQHKYPRFCEFVFEIKK